MKLRWCAGAAMALVLSSVAVTASAAPVTDADRAMARQMLEEAIAIPTAKGRGQVPTLIEKYS